jgi:hypothetical protein
MNQDYPTLAIPASLRLKIYVFFALVGLAISGTEVGYSTANLPQPLWLKIAIAVFSFLSVAVGYTAASHTPNVSSVDYNSPLPDPTPPSVIVVPPVAPAPAATTNPAPPVFNPAPPTPPTINVSSGASVPEGGFAAIGFIGVVLLIVGLLAIVGLLHIALAISVVLLVVGLLLVVADRSGTLRL